MRWLAVIAPLLAGMLLAYPAAAVERGTAGVPAGAFLVLSYHEVRMDVRDYPDPYAVDDGALVAQFAWLRGNGYTPVSLDDILAARAGGRPLPAKAVLLTFDDAYISFYTRVYPLLRAFGYPAVLAVVGNWIETPQGEGVRYGEKDTVPRASFPTWGELREMADSGLVEIASHSYDLHRGVPANPQGNQQPAATTRIYAAATGRYEADAAWRARVQADLARNAQVIEREIGRRPRAIVWPYGSYNGELVRMAEALGSPVALTLADGPNTPEVPLSALRRILVQHNPPLAEFSAEVRGPQSPLPLRAVQVSLDDIYSPDPAQQEGNLSSLLDRVDVLRPTHVYLQAVTDTNGDGIADAAYFPNHHLPVRADLFNRVAWQLSTRNDVKVVAVMPVADWRLSQEQIADVYADLARHASFEGLLFSDAPGSAVSTAFTQQLAARVRAFRAPLMTARSLHVGPATDAAQLEGMLSGFLAAYDQVVLTALPGAAGDSDVWLTALAARAGREAVGTDGRGRVMFMLHEPGGQAESAAALARQMRALQLGGALNFGYAPDDVRRDRPPLAGVAPAMSLRIHPPQNER